MNVQQRRSSVLLVLLSLLIAGCGSSSSQPRGAVSHQKGQSTQDSAESIALVAATDSNGDNVTPSDESRLARKVIYRSEIELRVQDFAGFEKHLAPLMKKHNAFVAERVTDRRHQNQRDGTWVIRVPVESYDGFFSGVSSLGFAVSRSETADDVTEAFVDLEARISNKRHLEKRIVEMLDQRAGKLSDVMEIERELSRVREEVERMEGRLRVLRDQTSLATITLSVTEEDVYEPPMAPSIADRLSSAWAGSVATLGGLMMRVVIAAVAILPWAVAATPLFWIAYRLRNRATPLKTLA